MNKTKKTTYETFGQILEKAIRKAVKNGWIRGSSYLQEPTGAGGGTMKTNFKNLARHYLPIIIFDHGFAEAFFPKKGTEVYENVNEPRKLVNWQWHLIQMVLWEEPVLYLERFLK